MKKIIVSLCLLLHMFPAFSQEDDLQRLLQERAALNEQYQYLNAQNSNFWGKKSKKDLLKIVDTLKEIINKDSEIIREINVANLKKQAQVTVERDRIQNQVITGERVVNDNFYELKAQLNSLQNLQKVKQRDFNSLQESFSNLRQEKRNLEILLVLAALILIALGAYIFTLRRRVLSNKVYK